MTWKVIFDDKALKAFKSLDRSIAISIMDFIENRLAVAENPRTYGAALHGSELGSFWKYSVGDFRIIVSIHDNELLINVVKIGNRKEVYR